MEWARTLRVDEPAAQATPKISSWLSREGVRVTFAGSHRFPRTYALVEGTHSVDPHELRAAEGRWYDNAIIALAIEPQPPDALPFLQRALGGEGAPAGTISAESHDAALLIEIENAQGAALALRTADVELRRFHGTRRSTLLAPLSAGVAADIAANGLQAPEIASGRILETLLGLETHVE